MKERSFKIREIIWARLRKNKFAIFGLIVIALLGIVAIIAPIISPYSPTEQRLVERLQTPSLKHFCGTDELGRDVFSRMLYGSRISLSVGLLAVFMATTIGIIIGSISGYFGGIIDNLLMRFVDIMLSIPTLFLILMLIVFLGPSIFNVMLVIGLTGWTDLSRLVRAEFLSLKSREYVLAAKAGGAGHFRIIFKHILPNALSPVFVSVIFGVAGAILLESGLSFLGLGVQPPTPSWGNILTSGKDYIESAWWLTAFPGLSIFITVLSYNLLGEGLRDALDPRLIE
ncbi:MAG: ABC transporter permease [Candidatus Firestonebacteria bacterium]